MKYFAYAFNRTTSVVSWSEFLATDRFPARLDFLRSSGPEMGSTQPWPTSSGRSVSIVHLRTKATEFVFVCYAFKNVLNQCIVRRIIL
jgi:hypothetical protein